MYAKPKLKVIDNAMQKVQPMVCLNLGNKYCMALAEYSVAFLEPTTPNVLGMLIIGVTLVK